MGVLVVVAVTVVVIAVRVGWVVWVVACIVGWCGGGEERSSVNRGQEEVLNLPEFLDELFCLIFILVDLKYLHSASRVTRPKLT